MLNACSFLASPLAALLSPSLYLAQLHILTSFAPRAFTLCCPLRAPLTHFVRSKSSSLAYRLAFVTYTHTYIHTYLLTYLLTYITLHYIHYIHAYMHTCLHTYIHACIHAYMLTYIHAYMHTCIHTCMHTCIHTYIHKLHHRRPQTGGTTTKHSQVHILRHQEEGRQEGRQKETEGRQDNGQQEGRQEGRQKETEGRQDGHNGQQEGRQTEGRQDAHNGDKADTVTNKKGDKKGDKGNRGAQGGHSDQQEGRQDRRQREEPCSISIHLPQVCHCLRPPFLATQHFYSFPNQCTSRGSQFFLKTCPPFLSLLASALFRWPCSVSIHLYQKWFLYFCLPSSVCPASVHPNQLAMQRFYSFASQMICLLFFSRFPFPAFLLIRLPGGFCTSPNWLYTVRGPQGFLRVSALLRDSVSAFRPACLPLSPFLLVTVSAFSLLSTEKGGHQQ